jgi:hypothetical protein
MSIAERIALLKHYIVMMESDYRDRQTIFGCSCLFSLEHEVDALLEMLNTSIEEQGADHE